MNAKSGIRYPTTDAGSAKPEERFEPFITKPMVAERMDVEIRTVTRLMRRGVLRYYKVGPMVRFKWSEVESDLREHFHVCFDPRRPNARMQYPRRGDGEKLKAEMGRTGGGR